MHLDYLDFEQPIAELQSKIQELQFVGSKQDINISEELTNLEKKLIELTKSTFSNLSDWQVVQVARHPQRPYALDYIRLLFTDFDELHGDRKFKDDPAIISGVARFEGQPVVIIAHQKGRTVKEKVYRNFGMAAPEGYRKAIRVMKLAEKFNMPILTFIDTAGAYPGIGAEARGQSEAIAYNLFEMSDLQVPIISTVIGEGGSGGALAIGVCDKLLMLEYSIYSVISPEGCASILWKDSTKASKAAKEMGLTSKKLSDLGLIDEIIKEPLGSAYRDIIIQAANIKESLLRNLKELQKIPNEQLPDYRYNKFLKIGAVE
tara:strand:+ start:10435 stop:11388 length:954 start_codon:yes stop_codon:yes gene_type:complete